MKSVAEKLRMFHRKLSLNFSSPSVAIRNFQVSTTAATESSAGLTEDEVKQINAVVPRLCSSNHLKEAIQLISAALSTANPPLNALPLSILINRLALEPDLTHHMHLLNALKFNPNTGNPFVLLPIAKMGLLREARVREALELNAALDCCALGSDDGAFGSKEVVDLLDRMIASWVE
ncbi:UNVERIFIED_CONTAM: hypothetical protein Slati_0292200 [Sesamum latifolium]|uniref:Uncharacterized protein n=1 Tax=Sesamum latifolium TaxID=2727402 RepID=A0AAW2YEA5_9LAMI